MSTMEDVESFNFAEHGGFFAFGQQQFDEQKQEGVEYLGYGGIGLYLPKDKAHEIIRLYSEYNKQRRKLQSLSSKS